MRDDGALDKGSSSGIGSKGTVFVDRVDVRYESKSAFRMTPNCLVGWSSHKPKCASLKVKKAWGRSRV